MVNSQNKPQEIIDREMMSRAIRLAQKGYIPVHLIRVLVVLLLETIRSLQRVGMQERVRHMQKSPQCST